MTIYGLAASLAWTATAVLFVARLSQFAHAWLALQTAKQPEPAVVIPDDLDGLVLAEQGPTAESTRPMQDQMRAVIRERYALYKDWNKVRAAMGAAPVSES